MNIVYSFLVFDLPHWGHMIHLKQALEIADVLIVGILDDDTVESYKRRPIMALEERMKHIFMVKGVDLVIPQFEKFPLENLKTLHKLFPNDKLICVHGKDWKREDFEPVAKYLESIGGELRLLEHFPKIQSTTSLIHEIVKRHKNEEKGTE